ncbi:hypothetical protein BDZ89DRAFT_1080921 [Hymenopellis radicata]|nr:hypothetical protein BDZ89DRAFT_1080921 [Hymenopellis radicata]
MYGTSAAAQKAKRRTHSRPEISDELIQEFPNIERVSWALCAAQFEPLLQPSRWLVLVSQQFPIPPESPYRRKRKLCISGAMPVPEFQQFNPMHRCFPIPRVH